MLAASIWRDEMKANGKSESQIFSEALIAKGFRGLLVPSFARGSSHDDLNIVLWEWSAEAPSKLLPIDDEGRLGKSN